MQAFTTQLLVRSTFEGWQLSAELWLRAIINQMKLSSVFGKTLKVFCNKCSTLLYKYDKKGSGHLIKIRPFKVLEDSTNSPGNWASLLHLNVEPPWAGSASWVISKSSCNPLMLLPIIFALQAFVLAANLYLQEKPNYKIPKSYESFEEKFFGNNLFKSEYANIHLLQIARKICIFYIYSGFEGTTFSSSKWIVWDRVFPAGTAEQAVGADTREATTRVDHPRERTARSCSRRSSGLEQFRCVFTSQSHWTTLNYSFCYFWRFFVEFEGNRASLECLQDDVISSASNADDQRNDVRKWRHLDHADRWR